MVEKKKNSSSLGDTELGADVEMIVGKGKMLGHTRSKVVVSELKIYALIKIIVNSASYECVYNQHEQQFRNSADSLGHGGQMCATSVMPSSPGSLGTRHS